MEEKLINSSDCERLALVGLGGVGKTQLALQLAYTVKERWSDCSILWVPAVSRESFEQAYREIASHWSIALAKEDPKKSVRQYLESKSAGKWLLIVDNVDDEEVLFGAPEGSTGVMNYLPRNENGLTLFTTRHRKMAVSLARKDIVEIEEMNEEEATTFLGESLIKKEMLQDRQVTAELLNELTRLPLAITQAVAYLNEIQIPLQEYLSLLKNTEQDTISLLSREFCDATRYESSKNAVAATWLVSFNHIRRSDPDAADLLSFMSCIEHKAIPQSMLALVEPKERMVHAMGTLRAYAFVTSRGTSHDMHRLVHLATKVWLGKHSATEEWNKKAVAHVATIFPSWDYSNRLIWREYFPHAVQILRNTKTLDIEARYDLCSAVGICLQIDGRIGEAVVWLSECFSWRCGRFPENHPSRLESQYRLAMAYNPNGQVTKAVEFLEQVVIIRKKMLAADHPSRLTSQYSLAIAYTANRQATKAIEILEQVVIAEKALAEDHPDRLRSQHELARAYRANSQVEKAIELLEQVVTIRKALAEDHPDRLTSQHELAIAYRRNGQVEKAIELLEQVVIMSKKVLAEDHPDRLTSQHELAIAYRRNSQVEKAIELLEQVVTIRKALAEDHPDRLTSQHELAIAYRRNSQVEKAIELLEQVVAIRKLALTEDHPDRLTSQHELAIAYGRNGQVEKAIELLEQVVIVQKALAEDNPDRLISEQELAIAYRKNGQVEKAIEILEQVVIVRKKVLAENHPDRLTSQYELAIAYGRNGQVEKAIELLEQVVTVQKALTEDHPDRLTSQYELAIAYRRNGQVEKAIELLEQVVTIGKKALAEDHPFRLGSERELSRLYAHQRSQRSNE